MRSSKKIITAVLTLCISLAALRLIDLALYPCTFTRNDIHAISTQAYDDLYLGTSHGKMNLDPAVMEEVTGHSGQNCCVGGQYPIDSYYIARLMIEKGNTPKRVIYATTPEYFVLEKSETNNYLLFYHEFPLSLTKLSYFWNAVAKANLRTSLFPWYEYNLSDEIPKIPVTFKKKVTGDYSIDDFQDETGIYHENGFIERYPQDPSTFRFGSFQQFQEEDLNEENVRYLRKLISLCRENGIEFVAINAPMPEPTLKKYEEGTLNARAWAKAFYSEQDVRYIDFNDEENYDRFTHKVTAFSDLDGHLIGRAARDFTAVLGKMLGP